MAKMTTSNLEKKPLNIVADHQPMYSSQAELYEKEKLQVFLHISNMITKLLVDKERLKRCDSNREDKMNLLAADTKPLHKIIIQLQMLVKLEKSRPALLTGNRTKDKIKFEVLKSKIEWMENSIDSLITRYNELGEFLNFPTQELFPEIKRESVPLKLDFISKEQRLKEEQQMKFKETQLILTDLRSSREVLKSKVFDHGIGPIYRLLSKSTSGQYFVYHYSCSLFGMYVEGSGNSKSEARENTATKMLRLILKKQKNLSLSSHILPFGVKELIAISHVMKSTENYVRQLERICAENKCATPTYELLSHTFNDKLESRYSIQCNAIDFVAIGHSNRQSTAKQIAAQSVVGLIEKAKSKGLPAVQSFKL